MTPTTYSIAFATFLLAFFAFGGVLTSATALAETKWVPVDPGYRNPPNYDKWRDAHGQGPSSRGSGLPRGDTSRSNPGRNTKEARYTTTYTMQDARRVQNDLRRSGYRPGKIVKRKIVKHDRYGGTRTVNVYDVYVYKKVFK